MAEIRPRKFILTQMTLTQMTRFVCGGGRVSVYVQKNQMAKILYPPKIKWLKYFK